MWYSKLLFPLYFFYSFLCIFLNSKLNINFLKLNFSKIIINNTLIRFNSSYHSILSSTLAVTLQLCETLPISINFVFRYRNKHYFEVCSFYFIFNKSFKHKILFKLITELLIFIFQKTAINSITNRDFLVFSLNFLTLAYYNKFNMQLYRNLCLNLTLFLFGNLNSINPMYKNFFIKFQQILLNFFFIK